jgi:hypothetical protein
MILLYFLATSLVTKLPSGNSILRTFDSSSNTDGSECSRHSLLSRIIAGNLERMMSAMRLTTIIPLTTST